MRASLLLRNDGSSGNLLWSLYTVHVRQETNVVQESYARRYSKYLLKENREICKIFLILTSFSSLGPPFHVRGRQNGYFKTRSIWDENGCYFSFTSVPFPEVKSERAVSPRNGYFCLIPIKSPNLNQNLFDQIIKTNVKSSLSRLPSAPTKPIKILFYLRGVKENHRRRGLTVFYPFLNLCMLHLYRTVQENDKIREERDSPRNRLLIVIGKEVSASKASWGSSKSSRARAGPTPRPFLSEGSWLPPLTLNTLGSL